MLSLIKICCVVWDLFVAGRRRDEGEDMIFFFLETHIRTDGINTVTGIANVTWYFCVMMYQVCVSMSFSVLMEHEPILNLICHINRLLTGKTERIIIYNFF
jgi:hypothetical protein